MRTHSGSTTHFLGSGRRRVATMAAALVVAAAAILAGTPAASAFKPAAHVAIMEAGVAALPTGNAVRQIMEAHPREAAWGANGPDLGFFDLGAIFGRVLWGARYHGDLGEAMATEQVRQALWSGDPARIAWAAGWIAHRRADDAAHGIYVDPEANTIADLKVRAARHNDLELWAEPVVWVDLAGRAPADYSAVAFPAFFVPRPDAEVRSLVRRASEAVFAAYPSDDDVSSWMSFLELGLTTAIGYRYTDHAVAVDELAKEGRRARLELAYTTAVAAVRNSLLAIQPGPSADPRPTPFPDLAPTHAYYSALLDLRELGALAGYADGRLGADDPVIRQQFAKMAVVVLGLSASETDVCPFTDVDVSGPSSLYPDNYVAAAFSQGLLLGRSATSFDPYAQVTRAAAVTIAARAASTRDALWETRPPDDWEGHFADFDDPTHGDNLRQAEFNGLLRGIDLDGWDPWAPATRGELAQILRNLPGW
jgi:hypothetical protein